MYCNEAFTVDNEAVEDWTSSLQMLQTFVSALTALLRLGTDNRQAAIFSAVLITLIVDSKRLLEQDKTEVLVDAVVFLMNNLANGTHRPYEPPKFQPTTQSILVNCFFFASLCLSITTALAAVLAMQWVTDYGAVTRRAGSTPEERVKRRHFRYQGGQEWRMDTIIGALPIVLHLSVLLFFVGLIVWMWDVHHSVFAVVIVCGTVAALFYVMTTILAIFYASCPYRTPLSSWVYKLLHLLVRVTFPSSWLATLPPHPDSEVAKGKGTEDEEPASKLRRFMTPLISRFTLSSLTLRDDSYIRSPKKSLIASSLVWLSNQLSISPDIYRRLLVFVDGFSSIVDPEAHLLVVPWKEIFSALGTTYTAFVETCEMGEKEFVEFARQTHCLSQSGMRQILESVSDSSEGRVEVGNPDFPVHLLRAWSKSTASHTSDALRSQRRADEVALRGIIIDIFSSSQVLMKTWYSLLDEETTIMAHVLFMILRTLEFGTEEQKRQKLDTALYMISARRLPWDSTVHFHGGAWNETSLPSNALVRRLRAAHWVDSLIAHPEKETILQGLSDFRTTVSMNVLLGQIKLTPEEEARFGHMGLYDLRSRTHTGGMLYRALRAFDQLLVNAKGIEAERDLKKWTLTIICSDLMDPDVFFDPKLFGEGEKEDMRRLSNPVLRLIACATLGIEWKEDWTPELLNAKGSIVYRDWERICKVCFKKTPFFDGDQTHLWALRLRFWIHFHPRVTYDYIDALMMDFELLKRVEREIQSTRLGIDKSGDFLLALFHLNRAYGWTDTYERIYTEPYVYTFIVDVLTQGIPSRGYHGVPKECIQYLSSICDGINADPARLLRLLIELIRADINHSPRIRRPQNLLYLLKHAEANFFGKELRSFSPSFRRLIRYIRASYQQFEATWDQAVNQHYSYANIDRGELKSVYERVVTLLEPLDAWEGELRNVSWSRDLLRSTGTRWRPFIEETEQGEAELNDERNEDNDNDGSSGSGKKGDNNEEEHEDQAERRLEDQPLSNSRPSREGRPIVMEESVE
ncbi:hypothetical protein FRC17_006750 [Serendipita sp. 399]|nr:hypothetical protein FRC17_006750 [Serendipita sp. 399]